jgi:hypothetical protein
MAAHPVAVCTVRLPFTQKLLANLLDITPERTSKILADLAISGAILCEKRSIVLLDGDGLRRRAQVSRQPRTKAEWLRYVSLIATVDIDLPEAEKTREFAKVPRLVEPTCAYRGASLSLRTGLLLKLLRESALHNEEISRRLTSYWFFKKEIQSLSNTDVVRKRMGDLRNLISHTFSLTIELGYYRAPWWLEICASECSTSEGDAAESHFAKRFSSDIFISGSSLPRDG